MPVAFKDYYQILGVARDATDADIKKAFRKLARKYHPDVAKDKKAAEAKFKEINEANEVLGDPAKRKKYDQLGANWQDEYASQPPPGRGRAGRGGKGVNAQEFHFGGTGFSDFFEQFFSGAGGAGFPPGGADFASGQPTRNSRARRGGDIEGDLMVTLEEAMHGAVRPITLQTVNPRTGEEKTHSFSVRIPPGALEGKRIRVPAEGEPGTGGAAPGDLILNVRHAAHPDFRTEGADLYHALDIAPWEAVLGAQIVVPTLDGSIKLRIPPGAENGQQLRARSRGLPMGKTGNRGDFYVTLTVRLPSTVSAEERSLWEKLRSVSTFNPRNAAPGID